MSELRLRTRYSYDRVAWCYESVAAGYSLGTIERVKASQVTAFAPGQRVLYVGVGAGEDAVLAARAGVELTCLDLSRSMLARLARRLDAESLDAELLECNIFDHHPATPYDAVVANFFLNVFSQQAVPAVMQHIGSLLMPGGRLLIADFSPPGRGAAQRWLHAAYYRPINLAAWALRLCALHPIYDYAQYLEAAGLRLVERHSLPLWSVALVGKGPRFFESLVAERVSGRVLPQPRPTRDGD